MQVVLPTIVATTYMYREILVRDSSVHMRGYSDLLDTIRLVGLMSVWMISCLLGTYLGRYARGCAFRIITLSATGFNHLKEGVTAVLLLDNVDVTAVWLESWVLR